jgi:hypothetical protein
MQVDAALQRSKVTVLNNTKWCCDKVLIPKGSADRSALTLKAFTQKPHKRICAKRYSELAEVMKLHDTWTPGAVGNATNRDPDRWRWPPATDPPPKRATTTTTTLRHRDRAGNAYAKRAFKDASVF